VKCAIERNNDEVDVLLTDMCYSIFLHFGPLKMVRTHWCKEPSCPCPRSNWEHFNNFSLKPNCSILACQEAILAVSLLRGVQGKGEPWRSLGQGFVLSGDERGLVGGGHGRSSVAAGKPAILKPRIFRIEQQESTHQCDE
jgi:hypothetical protein